MNRRIITGLVVALFIAVMIVPLSAATALKGYVTDEMGVLSQDAIQRMAAVSEQLKAATGVELATYVPKTMGDTPIEMFAEETFAASKIGEKGKDNGILFVVALNERKLRIEVGYGLEGILPDGRAGDIIRQVVIPRMKAKQIGAAIEAGHEAIASHIAAQNGVKLD
ncbi:TPM domain-containing protein, partial [bacterium]|nr:TPM domain-containing protein [bacterium]